MNFLDLVKLSIKGLRSRTLRTILTFLGIFIGVMLLTIVLTVSDSVVYSITNVFAKGGVNNVYVISGSHTLTWSDIVQIENIPHVISVSPYMSFAVNVNYGGYKEDVTLIGIPKDKISLIIPGLKVKEGSLIITSTFGGIVGSNLASKAENKGLKIRVGDVIYISLGEAKMAMRVEGLLESYGFTFIGPIDESIIVPYETIEKIYEDLSGQKLMRYNQLVITVDNVDNVDFVIEQLRYLYGKTIVVFAIKDIVKTITESMQMFTLIIGGIASVTLIVASVGVMNAMFTTVMERTRIIGVLRALGLKKHEVLLNILLEAFIMASIAILSGVPIGIIIGNLLIQGNIFSMSGPRGSLGTMEFIVTEKTIALIISVTLLLTLIGALPPAYRAAKLEPAQALRYE